MVESSGKETFQLTVYRVKRFLLFFLSIAAIQSSVNGSVLFTRGNMSDGSVQSAESLKIAIVNDQTASTASRINALEALTLFADPMLFDFFKNVAFRNPNKELSRAAVGLMGSFIGTYRWPELCDTLVEVVKSYPDESIRITTVQCLKITVDAFSFDVPFDRNNVIDALITIVSPATYIKDPVSFFDAVGILAALACKDDNKVIDMLDYLNGHFKEYILNADILATDHEQDFLNKIGKVYPDQVKTRTAPPLFDIMPENPTTVDYITAIAFMLDSAITDSLGFSAIEWLKTNGENDVGDEGKRLEYFYNNAYRKRPDKAAEIKTAMLPLLTKYGVGVMKKPGIIYNRKNVPTAMYDVGMHQLLIREINPGDRVALYDLTGKTLFKTCVTNNYFRWKHASGTASGRYIVTVNNRNVDLKIKL